MKIYIFMDRKINIFKIFFLHIAVDSQYPTPPKKIYAGLFLYKIDKVTIRVIQKCKWLEKYCRRSAEFDDLALFDFKIPIKLQ